MWRETRVAVKILLDTALDICNSDMHRQALTLSNPMLTNLHKVSETGRLKVAARG